MLGWVLQISLISLIFIFLVHHLVNFFKDTLTVPKIKDLVHSPHQKYSDIFDTINKEPTSTAINNITYTAIDLLPTEDGQGLSQNQQSSVDGAMKNELKHFLKKQLRAETAPESYSNSNF